MFWSESLWSFAILGWIRQPKGMSGHVEQLTSGTRTNVSPVCHIYYFLFISANSSRGLPMVWPRPAVSTFNMVSASLLICHIVIVSNSLDKTVDGKKVISLIIIFLSLPEILTDNFYCVCLKKSRYD